MIATSISTLRAATEFERLKEILKSPPPAIVEQQQELRELQKESGGNRYMRAVVNRLKDRIHAAELAYEDNKEACLQLLSEVEKRRNINFTDAQGRTLLMLAAATGHDLATEIVLKRSPALDITDKNGMTACDFERQGQGHALQQQLRAQWELAIPEGNYATIKRLLNCGADANWVINGEIAPILHALETANNDLFSLLLTYGASTETRLPDGRKLAEMAVEQQRADLLDALLKRGATLPDRLADGRSLFEHLTHPNASACLLAWLRHLPKEERIAKLCSLVRQAPTAAAQTACCEFRAELNAEDEQGNIPLHEAARRGHVQLFKLILELGGTPQIRNMRGENALMHAALSGNPTMLKTAIDTLPTEELHEKDENGQTARDYALLVKDRKAADALKTAAQHKRPGKKN